MTIPSDILAFISNNFPAGVSGKVLQAYQRSGRLPNKITVQRDLKGTVESFYPRQMWASHMFGLARAALQSELCQTGVGA